MSLRQPVSNGIDDVVVADVVVGREVVFILEVRAQPDRSGRPAATTFDDASAIGWPNWLPSWICA